MLFNKNANGSEEIANLTGNYYQNNNFSKLTGHLMLATSEVIKIIGQSVYTLAEIAYNYSLATPDNAALVPYVQLPIAIKAALDVCRSNDISHEDTGRKIKIDATSEKIPWEWQLKRDDELQLDRYYAAIDQLIAYLDTTTLTAWHNSDNKKLSKSLFINNASRFDFYFPINQSGRMYIMLLPFIREAERKYIKPALGTDYDKYMAATNLTTSEKAIHELIYPPIPLIAMSIAIKRMPLGLIPAGVVKNFISNSQTMEASDPAAISDIQYMSHLFFEEGMKLLDDMKRLKNGFTTPVLIPENDVHNKYMRV